MCVCVGIAILGEIEEEETRIRGMEREKMGEKSRELQ